MRVFHDQGTNDEPQGVTGRRLHFTDNPSNVVFNVQGVLGNVINEFKVGLQRRAEHLRRRRASRPRRDPRQPWRHRRELRNCRADRKHRVATPGQLVRTNSAGNGRSAPYDPYSLTIADTLSRIAGNHFMKFGGDVRLIRMSTDQQGGITYTYSNLTAFLANTPTQVQYFGDLSEASPFHNGASGEKHIKQEYYVGFAQDEWRVRPNFTLNYGLRYDYYAPLREPIIGSSSSTSRPA